MRITYRNEIFNLLNNSGISIKNFEIDESNIAGINTTIISYKESLLKFIINSSPNDFDTFSFQYVKFEPKYSKTSLFPSFGYVDFNIVVKSINDWVINHVKKLFEDQNEPDLWKEFKNTRKSLNFDSINFDERFIFTENEKKQIQISVNELKTLIQKKFNTTKQQQKMVNERLDYLAESANRLNKFDWKSSAVSTMISIAIALSLDTERGKMLFELFKQVFSTIQLLIENNTNILPASL